MADNDFLSVVQMVRNGEAVRAGVANRAPLALLQNVTVLRDLFNAALLGETVFARAQVVETDLKVGMACYYNAETQQFERAIGAVEQDPTTGAFVMTASSQVWGVVHTKHSSNVADILLHGVADLDLSLAISGDIAAGMYFLSNSVAGKLTSARPPVGVGVMQMAGLAADGKYTVYVNPKFHDLLEAHRHFSFELQARPAGEHTPPSVGERHEITDTDDAIEGWLPADHEAFADSAPLGAKFGYNIAASALNTLWPPIPVEGVYLEWNKGESKDALGMGVPLGADQLCLINRDGIWWMSDCYGDVPWATDYGSSESFSDSSSEGVAECPRALSPVLKLWFTKPVFSNTGTWVNSLRVAANSGLVLTCADNGDPATTGHLLLDFALSLIIDSNVATGHLALKSLTGGKVQRGPVVESLKAAGANVTLSSDVAAGEDGQKYGNLTLAVDMELDGRELPFDIVRLNGVDEEYFQEIIALGFTAGRLASYRGRMNVPAVLDLPEGTQLKWRALILNRSSTDMPAELFTVTYRRMAKPAALLTPQSLPISSAEVTLGSYPATLVEMADTPNQYFLVESDPFDIAAGDTVLMTVQRSGDSDGFSGDLYVLRQSGVYVLPDED